jgi:hypothetical protein
MPGSSIKEHGRQMIENGTSYIEIMLIGPAW